MTSPKLVVGSLALSLLTLALTPSCSPRTTGSTVDERLLSFVDPFIGTGEHGHTFPGATRPNAMVQFSPDTHLLGWDASSGYHATDSVIHAFSLTHLSGTGVGDLGDVALLPYSGADSLRPIATFDKETETASPGYYAVGLSNFGIRAELTSTDRVGLLRASYEDSTKRRLLLDLGHILQPNWGHSVVANDLYLVNDSTIQGTFYTKGWSEHHELSYSIHLSLPADSLVLYRDGKQAGRLSPGASFKRDTSDLKLHIYLPDGAQPVLVKTGISPVSTEGAERNLQAELPHWDFDQVHKDSRVVWAEVLNKIQIETQDTAVLRNFYTALYHAHIAPYNYQDVDGSFRGMDKAIHKNADPRDGHYTVFSLWDTYRTAHPLYALLRPSEAHDMVASLVDFGEQNSGHLPVWNMFASETDMMIGHHSIPVIVEAVLKGIYVPRDKAKLLSLLRSTAERKGYRGLDSYQRLGYIPADEEEESVSKTLEYAYDDAAIARYARWMGDDTVARRYEERSGAWRNLWSDQLGFFAPRSEQAGFLPDFDPCAYSKAFTGSNAY